MKKLNAFLMIALVALFTNCSKSNDTNGGANTGISPRITFDPATGVVTSIINNVNGAVITVNAGSRYNAVDRSIDLDWTLGRWHVIEHWRYLGPR